MSQTIDNLSYPLRLKLPWGYIDVFTNEVSIISDREDPPKVRMGAVAGGSLGCFSFGRVRSDGVQEEVVLIQGKIDERFRSVAEGGFANQTSLVGEVRVDVRRPSHPGESDDSQMVPVMQLRHDGVVFHVPATVGAAPSSTAVRAFDIFSPSGLYVFQPQDDNNFVYYRLERPFDKGRFMALWGISDGDVWKIAPKDRKWEGV